MFKTKLSEITSISLENTLNLKDNQVSGDFIVSGEYKVTDNSTTVEPFELKLPFEIIIDDSYDTSKATIDIDDFYYEIINDNSLSICIDVLINHLTEKIIVDELADVTPVRTILNVDEDRCIEEESVGDKDMMLEEDEDKTFVEEKINSIFSNVASDNDTYVTYNVFIVREGDTLESILEKYNTTEEELKKYNDLSNLKLGDKLIIPNNYERD